MLGERRNKLGWEWWDIVRRLTSALFDWKIEDCRRPWSPVIWQGLASIDHDPHQIPSNRGRWDQTDVIERGSREGDGRRQGWRWITHQPPHNYINGWYACCLLQYGLNFLMPNATNRRLSFLAGANCASDGGNLANGDRGSEPGRQAFSYQIIIGTILIHSNSYYFVRFPSGWDALSIFYRQPKHVQGKSLLHAVECTGFFQIGCHVSWQYLLASL